MLYNITLDIDIRYFDKFTMIRNNTSPSLQETFLLYVTQTQW